MWGYRPIRVDCVGLMRFGRWLADFPVVAVGVEDATEAPAVVVLHRDDYFGAGAYGALKRGVRIAYDHDHARGAAVEGFGAEVFVFGGFVGNPEFGALDG